MKCSFLLPMESIQKEEETGTRTVVDHRHLGLWQQCAGCCFPGMKKGMPPALSVLGVTWNVSLCPSQASGEQATSLRGDPRSDFLEFQGQH